MKIYTEKPEYVFGLTINDARHLGFEITERTKTNYSSNKVTAFPGESRLHVFIKIPSQIMQAC